MVSKGIFWWTDRQNLPFIYRDRFFYFLSAMLIKKKWPFPKNWRTVIARRECIIPHLGTTYFKCLKESQPTFLERQVCRHAVNIKYCDHWQKNVKSSTSKFQNTNYKFSRYLNWILKIQVISIKMCYRLWQDGRKWDHFWQILSAKMNSMNDAFFFPWCAIIFFSCHLNWQYAVLNWNIMFWVKNQI